VYIVAPTLTEVLLYDLPDGPHTAPPYNA
jgi:hypothetical protein